MAEAFLCKGLTIEYDATASWFSIDGARVQVTHTSGEFVTPDGRLRHESLPELAKLVVPESKIYRDREDRKREHVTVLKQGIECWNGWRSRHPDIRPILYGTNFGSLVGTNLRGADFSYADLTNAIFASETDLTNANFHQANLACAQLPRATLTNTNFCRADLYQTDLSASRMADTNLQGAQLAQTILDEAELYRCRVYGMAAWDLELTRTIQQDLVIRYGHGSQQTEMTVDDLQVAQYIYLLLDNARIRTIIDEQTSKVVLILGRFTTERKAVLDAMRVVLRTKNLVPVVFDFAVPDNRDVTETVTILAGGAMFVVADVTDATEVRPELHNIVRQFSSLPVQLLIVAGQTAFERLGNLSGFPSVLPPVRYRDVDDLLARLETDVVMPAMRKGQELLAAKRSFMLT